MAWDLTNAVYENKSFSVSTQEAAPRSLTFKPDGTKVYVMGTANGTVYQYSLSTAWDITTASVDTGKNLDISNQETFPISLYFRPNGLTLFVVGSVNENIYEYTLTTAWDVSTASYSSNSFNVSTQDTVASGLEFKPDGTAFFYLGDASDTVYQHSMSTAWDLSTASYASKSFSVGSQQSRPYGLRFKNDGTRFFIAGFGINECFQYDLSTAWDVSTASYNSVSFATGTEETFANGIAFKDDGGKMYLVGPSSDTIYQYSLEPLPEKASLLMHHMQIAGQITN